MTAALQRLGWVVWEDDDDLSDDIISQSKSDCGQEPENTILVLMTHPGRDEFVDLVRELKSNGVKVYLMSTESHTFTVTSTGVMQTTGLIEAVGHKHWIKLTGQVWSQVPLWTPTVGVYR